MYITDTFSIVLIHEGLKMSFLGFEEITNYLKQIISYLETNLKE